MTTALKTLISEAKKGDKPEGEGWEKVASVTSGGPKHFWYRRHNGERQWYVWDRVKKAWGYDPPQSQNELKTEEKEAQLEARGGDASRFVLLDNGGKTADRYSLFDSQPTGYEGDDPSRYVHQYVGFDENPSSPQGFGQHGDITQAQFAAHKKEKFRSLGKKIKLDDLDDKARAFADDFIRDSLA